MPSDDDPTDFAGRNPHHHAAKDEGGWRCELTKNGTTKWVTRLGKHHQKPAETYPLDLTTDKINKIIGLDDPPPF